MSDSVPIKTVKNGRFCRLVTKSDIRVGTEIWLDTGDGHWQGVVEEYENGFIVRDKPLVYDLTFTPKGWLAKER